MANAPGNWVGMTILDAISGNTGIAYAMVAAARGSLTLCLPKTPARNASEFCAALA
jgi:cysteine synthase